MTPDDYAATAEMITSRVARKIHQFALLFAPTEMSWSEWIRMLQFVYPEIEAGRSDIAKAARMFYDSQRSEHHPTLPRHDRPTEEYRFDWFVQNMEPVRKQMSQMDSRENAVAHMVLRAVREVENAGRRQIIHAVETDPEPQIVKGWARVATGRETCAWCLMLVSRGPVYESARTSGLELDDETAVDLYRSGMDVTEYMNQWHTGCDCKVVPVFNLQNWPGKEAADAALQLWIDASREAERLIESGEARTENVNRETINALRRRLARGEVNPSQFAAIAA
ncbi:capsid maturation protease [Mycobacterium phage UnionJack]|uniref:Capsid maturation protease n=1 Tax=Mycobacterium phage UnionJack TaxID=1673876 RepID=A0A0K1LJB8_9CAUD|nr:capsid maturation protease [Mycobacterium phage UnionJack]AKU42363.1 capsid maturation protease [Mycobacterium phage UnionJack]